MPAKQAGNDSCPVDQVLDYTCLDLKTGLAMG